MIFKQRNAKAAEIPPQTLTDELSLTMPLGAFSADLGGEQWAKTVPPKPSRLVTEIDAALERRESCGAAIAISAPHHLKPKRSNRRAVEGSRCTQTNSSPDTAPFQTCPGGHH